MGVFKKFLQKKVLRLLSIESIEYAIQQKKIKLAVLFVKYLKLKC